MSERRNKIIRARTQFAQYEVLHACFKKQGPKSSCMLVLKNKDPKAHPKSLSVLKKSVVSAAMKKCHSDSLSSMKT
jgi:hypothetical protein